MHICVAIHYTLAMCCLDIHHDACTYISLYTYKVYNNYVGTYVYAYPHCNTIKVNSKSNFGRTRTH